MGPIWVRQDPDVPHVGPMNFAIWEVASEYTTGIHEALIIKTEQEKAEKGVNLWLQVTPEFISWGLDHYLSNVSFQSIFYGYYKMENLCPISTQQLGV